MKNYIRPNDLKSFLDQINYELTTLDTTKYEMRLSNCDYDILDKGFFERIHNSLSKIEKIKQEVNNYKLENWNRKCRFGGDREHYFALIDPKGIKRYDINREYWSDGDLWVTEIVESYGCNRIASLDFLRKNVFDPKSIKLRFNSSVLDGIIYEDKEHGFLITTGSILGDSSSYSIRSVSLNAENNLEISYWYEERKQLQKWDEHSVVITVKLPDWQIINSQVTTETCNYK